MVRQASEKYRATGDTRAYSACPKKRKARQFVVDCWRAFSGSPSIPPGRQYLTLCGPMTASDGRLASGCELRQLESVGFCKPEQVIAAEIQRATYEANRRAVERAYPKSARPTLICGDILDVMRAYQRDGRLAASVVYLDTISEAGNAVPLLRSTLNVLNHIDGPTLVAWNVISERLCPRMVAYPWDVHDTGMRAAVADFIHDLLTKDELFREFYRHGWDMFPEGDSEGGAFGGARYEPSTATQMTTYVFVRRRKACGDDCGC